MIFHLFFPAQPINDSESISPNSTSKSSATTDETSSSSSFYSDGLFCSQCKKPFANKYSLMKHLRSTKCKLESEASINRVINDQLTCNKCKHQFGSVQALKKHVDGKKCMVHSNQSSNQIFRAGLVFDESIQLTPYATGLFVQKLKNIFSYLNMNFSLNKYILFF